MGDINVRIGSNWTQSSWGSNPTLRSDPRLNPTPAPLSHLSIELETQIRELLYHSLHQRSQDIQEEFGNLLQDMISIWIPVASGELHNYSLRKYFGNSLSRIDPSSCICKYFRSFNIFNRLVYSRIC